MSDTPRTDAVASDHFPAEGQAVSSEFARQLERELSETHKALKDALRALNHIPNHGLDGEYRNTYAVASMIEKTLRKHNIEPYR